MYVEKEVGLVFKLKKRFTVQDIQGYIYSSFTVSSNIYKYIFYCSGNCIFTVQGLSKREFLDSLWTMNFHFYDGFDDVGFFQKCTLSIFMKETTSKNSDIRKNGH